MNKITPLFKGLITGSVMIIVTLILFYSNLPRDSKLHYLVFALYAGGIAWTLLAYYRQPDYTGKFGDIFGKGFRCFIIITLIMVTFAGIFSTMHPEFAEEDARLYKEWLIKEKNKTPAEIDKIITDAKKNYTTKNMSRSVFGYLMTGAVFTAVGAGLLLIRRK